MSAYQIMEDMSVFRYRLIVHDEQEYTAFVIWPRVHPNYGLPPSKRKGIRKLLVFLLTKLHECKGYYAVSFVSVKLDFILKALLLYFGFCLDLVAKEIGLNIVLTTICLQDLQDPDRD